MEKLSDERLISIRDDGEAGGTFSAADVLSMIGEIIYSRKRIAELLNAYYKLEADALVSQEFQSDVLMPLFDQLEQAGYAGTWSQKVDAVLALKDKFNELLYSIQNSRPCHPSEPAYEFMISKQRLDEYFALLPLPPESEGK
jgi:hypothetical protein